MEMIDKDGEEFADELSYHEGLGYTRGYRDACDYFFEKLKEHRYWDDIHVRMPLGSN